VLATLITFAAEEGAEPSKTLFYFAGGLLVAYAIILGVVGVTRHETFPPSSGATRGLMLLSAALVAFAMASAVITA
jgi:hypothetical protein